MKKKALITGIRGQDGAYLAELLLKKGYEVIGADRRSGEFMNWRLKELKIHNDIKLIYMDLLELPNIIRTIRETRPLEIYNLAAQSFVSASFEHPLLTTEVDAVGVLRMLEAIRTINPRIKFYQASSSEMFGKAQESPQRATTPFYPRSPYAVSKLFAHWITVNYREAYNIFAASGILFNHESPLRGPEFVTRKITYTAAQIKYGQVDKLYLGNLDAKRDWGYAAEYVEAMWMMLQHKTPENFLIATGETHSVKEFTEHAFQYAGFDIIWKGKGKKAKGIDRKTNKVLIEVSPEFYRPSEVDALTGDAAIAYKELGWKPKVKFKELAEMMMEADLKRVKKEIE